METIERSRNGCGRDIWPALERHWRLTDPESETTMRVWNGLAMRWLQLDDNAVAEHVRAVAAQMHVIGYFFDIDPFARIGTFLPTARAPSLVPPACDRLEPAQSSAGETPAHTVPASLPSWTPKIPTFGCPRNRGNFTTSASA